MCISANFGQHEFTLDYCHFTENYFSQRRRKFCHDATSLPMEIVTMIATFAAPAAKNDTKILGKYAMVCSTWEKVCRPSMYERIHIWSVVQLHRLHTIFRSPSVQHLPREVCVGGEVTRSVTAPSLALVLSSLGHCLQRSRYIDWSKTRAGTNVAVHIREAPPRIEAAISALLRPLRNLGSLHLDRIEFQTLTQLFRIIRGLPRVRDVQLEHVEVQKAPGRSYWPPSLILTELQVLRIIDCSIPAPAIPALVSLGIRGTPSSNSILQRRRTLNGISLRDDDEHAMLQIAQALGHLHTLPGDYAGHGRVRCIFDLGGGGEDQVAEYMSVSCNRLSIGVEVTQMQESNISRIKAVTISPSLREHAFARKKDQKLTLAFLDTSLADISRQVNPPLTFQCQLRGWKINISNRMPLLYAQGRVTDVLVADNRHAHFDPLQYSLTFFPDLSYQHAFHSDSSELVSWMATLLPASHTSTALPDDVTTVSPTPTVSAPAPHFASA
ncbi:uncharacterized protein PHACADRAFT_257457 [Phanerochaete carnosa HHB-10118-sp]|uniref:Uncharacterized protein n=1 Tax=Phanerochaete carnosa (strain HHB-10118-sp) TaxID=650164 RepID=K5W4T2_PHACS|nr:uncharacterized protein PHACADRAFT_257457 [Phanerochaete carnosa HHB-10118-sp]EKM53949.1 hypothetical protein PHACADRAFT_257457 [Phanerochaete carnosa HHB-10118-sp]